jgi:quercetin dioxygenase-like cupin family protein
VRAVSTFADAHAIPPHRIWDGVVARAVQGDQATLALLELAPDSVVPEHSHPNEQLGICIEGSLTFTVGGETRELGPGGTWRILGNVPHSVVTGPQGAVVAEVFAPARGDWDAIEPDAPRAPVWPKP